MYSLSDIYTKDTAIQFETRVYSCIFLPPFGNNFGVNNILVYVHLFTTFVHNWLCAQSYAVAFFQMLRKPRYEVDTPLRKDGWYKTLKNWHCIVQFHRDNSLSNSHAFRRLNDVGMRPWQSHYFVSLMCYLRDIFIFTDILRTSIVGTPYMNEAITFFFPGIGTGRC